MRANYHTHTEFCDGKAAASAMATAAFAAGYKVLGFSSHAPLPFSTVWNMEESRLPAYIAEIRRLKGVWAERDLEILLGLEIDWIESLRGPGDPLFERASLDFRICSVHFIKPGSGDAFNVDAPLEEFEANAARETGGDGSLIYRSYYRALCGAIEAGHFDILGHLDLVVRNNGGGRWFDEDSAGYRAAANEALDLLGKSGAVVEINLGPLIRGKSKQPHPSLAITKRLRELGVPITFSADAHNVDHFGRSIESARELARAAGYTSIQVLSRGRWSEVGIEET